MSTDRPSGRVRPDLGLAALLLVAACSTGAGEPSTGGSPVPTVSTTPALQEVVDAAEEEGALQLTFFPGILGDADGVEQLVEGFEHYYGVDLDVRVTPGSGQGETAAKVEQELGAGLPASADILSLNASAVLQLAGRGVLQEVAWTDFSPDVTEAMVAPDGVAVAVQSWVLGIAYHTGRVDDDEAPTTLEQLREDRYEGRVYTTPFGAGFDLLASEEGWGRERTLDFVEDFSAQVGGLGFNIQPLLSGEFDIMALTAPPATQQAFAAQQDGAPIEVVVPTDAALTYEHLMGIPANAAHPDAAKLFVAYLMSPDGQATLRELDFADSPLVDGSRTAAQIAEAEADGAEFIHGDVDFYRRQDPEQYRRNADDIVRTISGGG